MTSTRPLRALFAASLAVLLFSTAADSPAGAAATVPDPGEGAAAGLEGRWFLDFDREDGLVQLSMERRSGSHHSQSSSGFRLEELRDLRRPAGRDEVPARFSLVRDAGTFTFEGHLDSKGGAGRFRFAANPDFERAWSSSGRGSLSSEQIYSMAMHDVSRGFIQDLRALGYEELSADQLIAMRIHGVSVEFVRDLQTLGYRRLPADQLIAFRIHGVSPAMIRDLSSQGYERIPADQLVSMRIHGATPEYVRELRALGYERIPADQLVSMKIHGVDPGFVWELSELGFRHVPVDDLVSMRIHNVTIDFVRRVQARDRNVSVDELVSRRIHGRTD